jgi:hypothetical protein
MNEKSDNICIELRTRIDDADRRIMDLNANRFGASENAKAIELPLSTLSVRLCQLSKSATWGADRDRACRAIFYIE